jgi:hypothetical protein
MSKIDADEICNNTGELDEEQETVFFWNSHCLWVCPECVGWWVCDHHWQTLWGDVQDNSYVRYIYGPLTSRTAM